MQLTETHQIRPNHKLYSICDELCLKAKIYTMLPFLNLDNLTLTRN